MKPALYSLGMMASGYAMKRYLDEYTSEDNPIYKVVNNYGWGRVPVVRLYNSLSNRVSNPVGVLKSVSKMMAYPFGGWMYMNNPYKGLNPVRLNKIADLESKDIREVSRAMKNVLNVFGGYVRDTGSDEEIDGFDDMEDFFNETYDLEDIDLEDIEIDE